MSCPISMKTSDFGHQFVIDGAVRAWPATELSATPRPVLPTRSVMRSGVRQCCPHKTKAQPRSAQFSGAQHGCRSRQGWQTLRKAYLSSRNPKRLDTNVRSYIRWRAAPCTSFEFAVLLCVGGLCSSVTWTHYYLGCWLLNLFVMDTHDCELKSRSALLLASFRLAAGLSWWHRNDDEVFLVFVLHAGAVQSASAFFHSAWVFSLRFLEMPLDVRYVRCDCCNGPRRTAYRRDRSFVWLRHVILRQDGLFRPSCMTCSCSANIFSETGVRLMAPRHAVWDRLRIGSRRLVRPGGSGSTCIISVFSRLMSTTARPRGLRWFSL